MTLDAADNLTHSAPRAFLMSLESPVHTFVGSEPLPESFSSGEPNKVLGVDWYPSESPFELEADILYQPSSQTIVGLTWEITDPQRQLGPTRRLIDRLDPSVVRLEEFGTEEWHRKYEKSRSKSPFLEILWMPCNDCDYVFGHFICGWWWWYYAIPNPNIVDVSAPWTVPVGISIGDVQELLNSINQPNSLSLKFPPVLPFPQLRVPLL